MSTLLAANPNAFNDVQVVKDIANRRVEAFTNTSVPQRRVFIQVGPSSAISSTLAGSEYIFRIENNVDRIGTCYLRVDYSNTSGGNFVVSAGPMQIEQIQIYGNNQSTLLYQTTDPVQNFLIDAVTMSKNEWDNSAAIRGTSSAYATGVLTIATATTGSIYYSIAPNFWRSLHLRPYCIDGNIMVKIRFQSASNIVSSGSMTITGANLLFTGYMESKKQKDLMTSRAEKPKALSYYAPQTHLEVLTLAASTTYSVRLSGITGWVNQLYFVIRTVANATTPNNQFSFVRPATFDILDPSGKSLTGQRLQSDNDMIMLYSHLYDNQFILNTNACVYSFSQNPVGDIASGSWHGGIYMNGSHYLQFTTSSGLAGASYQILVYGMCNEMLSIEGADLIASRR